MSHQPDSSTRSTARKRSSQQQQQHPPRKLSRLQEAEALDCGGSQASTQASHQRRSKKQSNKGAPAAGTDHSAASTSTGRRRRGTQEQREVPSTATSSTASTHAAAAASGTEPNNNLKDRISNLCDYFPEVNVPNFKRITRSFTRRLSNSREGSDGDAGRGSQEGEPPEEGLGLAEASRDLPTNLSGTGGNAGSSSEVSAGAAGAGNTSATGACGSISSSVAAVLPSMRGSGRNSVAPAKSNSTGGIPSGNAAGSGGPQQQQHQQPQQGVPDANAAARDSLEVGRLQALLEASGLSGHFFSALAPRMHGILHRGSASAPGNGGSGSGSSGSSTHTKVQSLIAGMQQMGDKSTQLQSVMEMCQLLLLGNEDTLGSSFPIKQLVQVLMQLLTVEDNFDLMTHACRALTYAMEALPRSTTVVCDALPLLLAKLQHIECMDVAEQALTTVEMLSRRHSKAILCASGISACLAYIDFFSLPAQRNALVTTANCCYHMTGDEFKFVANSLPILTQRLSASDKKSIESACLCFTRLTDSFQSDPVKLETIASSEFLKHILQLLVVSPPVLTTQTFMNVTRMLYQMSAMNSLLAVKLLKHNISDALRFLLVGSAVGAGGVSDIELVARSPQELHEMVCLIGELMPRLPSDGIFSIDALLQRSSGLAGPHDVIWQWKDDSANWRSYSPTDCRILETAFQARDMEVSLNGLGSTYTVDFQNMIQINEDTGNSRPVQRKTTSGGGRGGAPAVHGPFAGAIPAQVGPDARLTLLETEPVVFENFVEMLFPILYEIYVNAAGPSIRHECLSAIRRVVYHSPAEMLEKLLKDLSVSSHIANMLDCQDLKLVVGALQLVHILLQKLPDAFTRHFRREGVLHQLDKLATAPIAATPVSVGPNAAGKERSGRTSSTSALHHAKSAAAPRPVTWSSEEAVDRYYRVFSDSQPSGRPPPPPPFDFQFLAASGGQPQPLTKAGSVSALSDQSLAGGVAGSGGSMTTSVGPYFVSDVSSQGSGGVLNLAPGASGGRLAMPSVGTPDFQGLAVTTAGSYGLFRWMTPQVPLFDAHVPPPPVYSSGVGWAQTPPHSGPGMDPPSYQSVDGGNTPASSLEQNTSRSSAPVSQCLTASLHSYKKEKKREKESFASRRKRADGEHHGGSSKEKSGRDRSSTTEHKKSRSHSSRGGQSSSRHSGTNYGSSSQHGSSARGGGAHAANGGGPASQPPTTASRASSFLSSFPIPKWARMHHSNSAATTPTHGGAGGTAGETSSLRMPPTFAMGQHLSTGQERLDRFLSVPSNYFYGPGLSSAQNDANKQKIREWIKEQAEAIRATYFSAKHSKHEDLTDTLEVLKKVAVNLNNAKEALQALEELRSALDEDTVSPFEILHSGLVEALITYLTQPDEPKSLSRADRLKLFCSTFLNLIDTDRGPSYNLEASRIPMGNLVSKINACLTQTEQFPVKVHDIPSSGSGQLRGVYALKFFHTHQLKCYLRRHPAASNVRQWRRGPVKIDPLASIAAVERYLVLRGYGRSLREGDESDLTDSEDSENPDEEDASVRSNNGAAGSQPGSQGSAQAATANLANQHQLQFLINDHVLPYNMTLYQAIRQYGLHPRGEDSAADTDTESNMMGYAAVWVSTHTLHYRLAPPSPDPAEQPSTKEDQKTENRAQKHTHATRGSKSDPLWTEGKVPDWTSPLEPFLVSQLPMDLTVKDMSLKCLVLLRVLHALNRYWWCLYDHAHLDSYKPALTASDFVNSKIAAKANRQLRDPLMILTGNIPQWLRAVAQTCPFVLPFETRHLLLYVVAFDRDRALQRLLDTSPDLVPSTEADRIAPRLERKKLTITRDEFFKQAEWVLSDMAGSKHVLEVQYKDEVGTGLGPTLEFYAIMSKEFQRFELSLWRGERLVVSQSIEGEFVNAPHGLYPSPLPHNFKPSQLGRIRSRFKMLGRLMARTLMDSRMMDLPLNPAFYRWLLSEERYLSYADLSGLDPVFYRSMGHLFDYVRDGKRDEEVSSLDLDFTLPGQPSFELMKGGRNSAISTSEELSKFLRLTLHWYLKEGVGRQMDAFKEGFESVMSLSHLSMFYADEMDRLFCGQQMDDPWDPAVLHQCIRPDHGYTADSEQIRWLVEVLASLDGVGQRRFLQFATGCPKLPIGGLRSLNPPLTVVRRSLSQGENPDHFLPSVMTCVNYLKLPAYSSLDVMRNQLMKGVEEGQESFHLS